MIKKYTPFIHRIIARNKHLFKFTLMIRNQCYCIIQNHVSDGVDLRYNGEKLIIEEVAGLCNSFVDVGANIGEWSKEFLKSNPEISIGYLFEPNPQYFSKLKKEFSEERCKLFNFALSNKEYQTSFIIDGRSSRIDLIEYKTDTIDINVKTLDNLFPNEHIDFIKIDSEGHDLKVIKGFKNMIKENRCTYIQFEYNDLWIRTCSNLYYLISYLEANGFNIFRIHKNGLHEISKDELGEYFRYSNFIAVSTSKLHTVKRIVAK